MYETDLDTTVGADTNVRLARLGIIGGGQLARMTAMAAAQLGCDVAILERHPGAVTAVTPHVTIGDWNDPAVVAAFARDCDVVTLENEFIDAAVLAALEARGVRVAPGSAALAMIQDKFVQKETFRAAGVAVPAFARADSPGELRTALAALGTPAVLKARRNAYDGKGNATVHSGDDVDAAWERLNADGRRGLYVEAWCDYTMELATIVVRAQDGTTVTYPVVETVQRNHVCTLVRAPAAVHPRVADAVTALACRAAEVSGIVGCLGVECFLRRDGSVLLNEVAPRVHNSGHYTIEACESSQFDNHVRAVLGLPLGSTRMVTDGAVMVNLLGRGTGVARPLGLARGLDIPGAHVHLYGKRAVTPGRKLGHVTALGRSVLEAEARATASAGEIRFGEET